MLRRDANKVARLINRYLAEGLHGRPTGELSAVRAFSSILRETPSFEGHRSSGYSCFSHPSEAYQHRISRGFSAEGGFDGQFAEESAGQLQDGASLSVAGISSHPI